MSRLIFVRWRIGQVDADATGGNAQERIIYVIGHGDRLVNVGYDIARVVIVHIIASVNSGLHDGLSSSAMRSNSASAFLSNSAWFNWIDGINFAEIARGHRVN